MMQAARLAASDLDCPAREAARAMRAQATMLPGPRGQAAIAASHPNQWIISARLDAALHGSRAFRTIRRAR